MVTSKLEVLVEFGNVNEDSTITNAIDKLKNHNGITDVQFKNGAFMVETTLASAVVLDLISSTTGRRSVLQGFGDEESAVSMISNQGNDNRIHGVVRFQQSDDSLLIDGTVDGLKPGDYRFNVHETGDLSQGCNSIGDVYNPKSCTTGRGKAGELGMVHANETGRADFRIINNVLKVSDIIGRSVALSEINKSNRLLNEDSWIRVACGIIARSAGIFQNPKRICACDGVVVWDERDRPLAGKGRRKDNIETTENVEKKCCCNKL